MTTTPKVLPTEGELTLHELRVLNSQLATINSRLGVIRGAAFIFIISFVLSLILGIFLTVQAVRTSNWTSCMANNSFSGTYSCGAKP